MAEAAALPRPLPRRLRRPHALTAARLLAVAALALLALLGADTQLSHGGWGGSVGGGNVRLDIETLPPGVELPGTDAVTYLAIGRDRAREINAAVPFSTAPNPAARPFRLGGDAASQARALDCLAAAQYYEAGTDWEGQRAVAQVVLNRARHPAYPGSICGVVFQGAERSTGCQFTFTCDGALARTPVPALWQRTLAIAREMLEGRVFARVGHATHYHTDWVVPHWSSQLEKITAVQTHLFFRWPGSWGRPGAFRNGPSAPEPVVAKLAHLSPVHRAELSAEEQAAALALIEGEAAAAALAELAVTAGAMPDPALPALPGVNLRGSELRLAHPDGDAFGFLLGGTLPGAWGLLAYDVCEGRSFCKVMGWTDPALIPRGFPVPFAAQEQMAFLYQYDRASRREVMAWNCTLYPRNDPEECLTPEMTRWDALQ